MHLHPFACPAGTRGAQQCRGKTFRRRERLETNLVALVVKYKIGRLLYCRLDPRTHLAVERFCDRYIFERPPGAAFVCIGARTAVPGFLRNRAQQPRCGTHAT